jgi:type III restriction enzyme
VNTLTVMATESTRSSPRTCRRRSRQDTGIRFGIVEQHQFATLAITARRQPVAPLGVDQSKALWEHLKLPA